MSKNRWLWALTGLLALTFLITGASKLFAVPPSPENFARWGFSPAFMRLIGAVEVVGAIALLFPRVALLSVLMLGADMLGALRTGVVYHEALHIVLPLILLGLLCVVGWGWRATAPWRR